MPHPDCVPVVLGLLTLSSLACVDRPGRDAECARAIAAYEETYGDRYADHTHPDFDRTLAAADEASSSGARSCQTLQALAASIRADRGAAPAEPFAALGAGTMTVRHYLALAMLVLLALVAFVAQIWLIVEAFQESVAWGIVVLIAPLGALIFAILAWERAKVPFLLNIGATVACVLPILLMLN